MANKYGEWKIQKSLGEGGQAHVFIVENSKDGRIAVLKRLKNIKRLDRFKTEFEVMKNHNEDYFPVIFHVDLECEQPYYVMEYFPNGCLSEDLIKDWTLSDKVNFYISLVKAVAYANNRGIVHRDLKPGNILVTNNKHPRVTDFGICFIDDDGERKTLLDEAVGSFRFMAPEMEDGRADKIGPQTDIYSLGKIAYWLFASKIYNRERHRDPNFDLTNDSNESWRYYLNDYLDAVTNPNPEERPQETDQLIEGFSMVRKAIQDNIRYLDLNIDHVCSFCGFGSYKVVADGLNPSQSTQVRNFGYVPVGVSQWLIMCCDKCGNVQAFRKDRCEDWRWNSI